MLYKVLLNIFLFSITKDNCIAHETEIETVYGDEGSNLTLPCKNSLVSFNGPVMWRHQGRDDKRAERTTIRPDNSLVLTDISREDVGLYTCIQDNDAHRVINVVKVLIRTPPPALVNVTVQPSTILALLHWEVADTGGYPITHFTAQYRLKHTPPHQLPDPWHLVFPDKINPTIVIAFINGNERAVITLSCYKQHPAKKLKESVAAKRGIVCLRPLQGSREL
ncbi:hypothetical protein O3M35_001304 [Rhynocoris fuscipes]|uniref:Ig-like domain-containing protein n=1 Tax=Rhynocoris fuscipes TaxID=488301 RepID=A0AAW1DQH0_9HEMI